MELAALAEKDPAFYKYLQANDKELLNFSVPAVDDMQIMSQDGGFALDDADDAAESDEEARGVPILTADKLKVWQKAILEVRNGLDNDVSNRRPPTLSQTRSLRALKGLLVAFRSAARMKEDDEHGAKGGWRIEEATGAPFVAALLLFLKPGRHPVFNKLVVTAFKYTPVVLEHHIPYKVLPGGKL